MGWIVQRRMARDYYTGIKAAPWGHIRQSAYTFDSKDQAIKVTSAQGWKTSALVFRAVGPSLAADACCACGGSGTADESGAWLQEKKIKAPVKGKRAPYPRRCSAEDLARMYPSADPPIPIEQTFEPQISKARALSRSMNAHFLSPRVQQAFDAASVADDTVRDIDPAPSKWANTEALIAELELERGGGPRR